MRPLYLDFLRERRHRALAGPVLLGAALAATAALGLWFAALDGAAQDAARREAGNARRDPALQRAASATLNLNAEEERRMAAALAQLTTPWEDLLTAVERATSEDIAVLALEQDAAQSSLKLLAEARDPAAMLAFVRRVGESKALRAPTLETHKIDAQQPGQPVRFSITARYAMQP